VPISAATDINPLKTLSPFTSTITNELSKCKRKFGSYRSVQGTFELSISSRPHSRIRRATTCDHRARRAEAGRIGALAADPRGSPGVTGLLRQPPLWSGIPKELEDAETRGSITTKGTENRLKRRKGRRRHRPRYHEIRVRQYHFSGWIGCQIGFRMSPRLPLRSVLINQRGTLGRCSLRTSPDQQYHPISAASRTKTAFSGPLT
jgi:hypothetical protein